MPASNIGGSDVIGLLRDLKKRERRRETRGEVVKKQVGSDRNLLCKTEKLELIHFRNLFFWFV